MADHLRPVKVLVVGCGNMGASHAMAYHLNNGFEIVGLVSRGQSKELLNARLDNRYPLFETMDEGMKATQPDAVAISTYPDTHEEYAIKAFEANCHVFIEKTGC